MVKKNNTLLSCNFSMRGAHNKLSHHMTKKPSTKPFNPYLTYFIYSTRDNEPVGNDNWSTPVVLYFFSDMDGFN